MNQLSLVYPKYALGRSEVLSKQQGGLLVNCYKKTIAMVEIAIFLRTLCYRSVSETFG